MNKVTLMLCVFAMLLLAACGSYEPSTTDRAAVAGAVVGSVAGGVVGSSAGNTVAGVGLGGVAGAGVGALIGGELRDRDEQIAEQNRELLDARREISRQQREIQDLRQATSDNIETASFIEKDNLSNDNKLESYFDGFDEGVPEESALAKPLNPRGKQQVTAAKRVEENPSNHSEQGLREIKIARGSSMSAVTQLTSRECQEAEVEAGLASNTEVIAEKLYHLRRALRLCPDNPDLHIHIAEVYLTMGRREHAKNELLEAVELDSGNSKAKSLLAKL